MNISFSYFCYHSSSDEIKGIQRLSTYRNFDSRKLESLRCATRCNTRPNCQGFNPLPLCCKALSFSLVALHLSNCWAKSPKILLNSSGLLAKGEWDVSMSFTFHSTPLFSMNMFCRNGGKAWSCMHRMKASLPANSGSSKAVGGAWESNACMEVGRRSFIRWSASLSSRSLYKTSLAPLIVLCPREG